MLTGMFFEASLLEEKETVASQQNKNALSLEEVESLIGMVWHLDLDVSS